MTLCWRRLASRYGKHLLIQMNRGDTADTVARLTEIGRNSYESAFRSHTGR